MPPPTPSPHQIRRPTRPRPLRRRVFARSSAGGAYAALESGLDAMVASGHVARAVLPPRKDSAAAAAAEPTAGPSASAGDELFVASPLTLSPAPSPTPIRKASTWMSHTPQVPPARPIAPAMRLRSPTPAPRTPRFPAPPPSIAVGRFPSPPRGQGWTVPPVPTSATTSTATPPNMPALSPTSPMDVATPAAPGPSYATVARTLAASIRGITTTAATTTAAAAAATTSAATTTPTGAPKPANRYPPLIVEVLPDWTRHFKELKQRLGHAPNGRPFGKGVRFIPKSDHEFRLIQRYLTQLESEVGISWFCYSLPAERSVKVAIRGLPANTEPALVEQELRELGHMPEFVRAIPARPGRPGCLMFAQLQRTPDTIPGIYETHELLCMPGITIEAWRGRKGPSQCHRCQQFRHSSHNCHRPIVCVRCGGNHPARDCQRPREEPATCANCGGAHTASNSACPAYRKEARNRRAGTVARTATGTRPATATTTEPNAPGSLMAVANQPQQQPGRKRRRKRGKRARAPAPPSAPAPPAQRPTLNPTQSKAIVVAASDRRTKAKRAAPQPEPQPACGSLDPRLTTVVGTLNGVLTAIREQRDPVPLILGCIAELCQLYG